MLLQVFPVILKNLRVQCGYKVEYGNIFLEYGNIFLEYGNIFLEYGNIFRLKKCALSGAKILPYYKSVACLLTCAS